MWSHGLMIIKDLKLLVTMKCWFLCPHFYISIYIYHGFASTRIQEGTLYVADFVVVIKTCVVGVAVGLVAGNSIKFTALPSFFFKELVDWFRAITWKILWGKECVSAATVTHLRWLVPQETVVLLTWSLFLFWGSLLLAMLLNSSLWELFLHTEGTGTHEVFGVCDEVTPAQLENRNDGSFDGIIWRGACSIGIQLKRIVGKMAALLFSMISCLRSFFFPKLA